MDVCKKNKINNKGFKPSYMDHRTNGVIFYHLSEIFDGSVTDIESYLSDIFYAFFGRSQGDEMVKEFKYFKKLFESMPPKFREGIELARKSKNKKKVLYRALLMSEYCKHPF